jgi:signal transduction histidine kinase
VELTDSLRTALVLEATEVWTGSGGLLERVTSDPKRGWASLTLAPAEESVVARAGVSGPGWLEVWLPALLEDRGGGPIRVAPMVNARELLGLVVAERRFGGEPFGELDERVLAEFARQVGLALHNVRLDSQLEASLDEVKRQTEQVTASRARVVSAADAERRRIERDLHDGAQQQLVALCANLRLARELAGSDPAQATALLEQLGNDIEAALEELRELAHGIYPPLLADRGLPEALSAVGRRAPVRTRVETEGIGRYPPQVESTVYFCCLEALQNVGKHAGEAGSATVRVWEKEGGLLFEVSDDGAGFDPEAVARGAGLTNMTDRLGAIGGTLRIKSAPGRGTRIAGAIPLGR